MKGYSPTFSVNHKSELASKIQQSFIELGVKNTEHEDNCKCDKCIKKENT